MTLHPHVLKSHNNNMQSYKLFSLRVSVRTTLVHARQPNFNTLKIRKHLLFIDIFVFLIPIETKKKILQVRKTLK